MNISILPTTMTDFPIFCHLKQDHMAKELVVNHLTDRDEPERQFSFGNTRFVCFLGLGRFQAESRIAFLGADIDDKDLSITVMSHDSSYKKAEGDTLDKWSVQKFIIEPFTGLRQNLGDIKKAFMVEKDSDDSHLRNPKRQPAILIQTSSTILFAQRNLTQDVLKDNLNSEEFELVKIDLVRGVNNRFYFVIKENSSQVYFVYSITVRFKVKENQWNVQTRPIFVSQTGAIIALVKDQDYPKEIDSYWTQENLIQTGKDSILNQLYLLDSQYNLIKLRQGLNRKALYRVLLKKNV